MLELKDSITGLTNAIGYRFKDESLLVAALTHKSVLAKESISVHGFNNERLEFLGDAILSAVSADFLYKCQPRLDEGDLSRLRAQYICQSHLGESARKIDLGGFIFSDKAMKRSGSTNSKAVLSDALEAVIGAVFLDGGIKCAEAVIFKVLGLPKTDLKVREKDSKTTLQEAVQATTKSAPKYHVVNSSGPAHAPFFTVAVEVDGEVIAESTGESKKGAEQNAANIALGLLNSRKSEISPE